MQRASFDVIKLTSYLEYYANLDDDYNSRPTNVKANDQDVVTIGISIFTGFIDGSFRAGNTSYCRKNLKLYTGSFSNATDALFNT